ncbi:MAG: hypothetical protein N3A54_02085 [Patescibacteria group bacterium]|nr:hypothetical protein [Patescibacteria group bacterium]
MKDCAILVLSCDKYSDLWDPFFDLFKRYWKDCPFPVYLGSNTKKYSDGSIKTILSGSPKDWSTDLLNIVDKIREEFLFIWLEDFLPCNSYRYKKVL